MKTILSCEYKLECNKYVGPVTTMADYEKRAAMFSEADVRRYLKGAKLEMAGFLDCFDPLDDYEIRPLFLLDTMPGPPAEEAIFDLALSMMIDAIRNLKQKAKEAGEDPDKVPAALLLALHGANCAVNHEDADGDFLEALRKEVGPDCPIMTSLDLHVNLSKKMVENATALFPCEYYPHTDFYETGLKAAKCMLDTLEGRVHPVMALHQLPLLFPPLPTGHESFIGFREKIKELNEIPGVLNLRFAHGFFAADVTEGGAAVLAVTDNDPALAKRLADDLAEEIYAKKETFFRKCFAPDEAIREAKRLLDAGVHPPIVFPDVADNPGSGATEDTVALLDAMIRSGIPSMFSVIHDPETVQQCCEAGVGSELDVRLGGKTRPDVSGGPLELHVKVLQISDGEYRNEGPFLHNAIHRLGKSVLIQAEQAKIIVSSFRLQPADRACFHHFGLSPETCPLVGVKSVVHFRASYEPVAGAILEVETPGLSPIDPRAFTYKLAPSTFYPLTEKK